MLDIPDLAHDWVSANAHMLERRSRFLECVDTSNSSQVWRSPNLSGVEGVHTLLEAQVSVELVRTSTYQVVC